MAGCLIFLGLISFTTSSSIYNMSKNLDVEIGDLLQRLQDKLEERDAAQATNFPEIPRSPGSGLGGEYVNELTPPAGTMFFKRSDLYLISKRTTPG